MFREFANRLIICGRKAGVFMRIEQFGNMARIICRVALRAVDQCPVQCMSADDARPADRLRVGFRRAFTQDNAEVTVAAGTNSYDAP